MLHHAVSAFTLILQTGKDCVHVSGNEPVQILSVQFEQREKENKHACAVCTNTMFSYARRFLFSGFVGQLSTNDSSSSY